ncbi:nucleoside-diphosphate kinase [Candidatus Fermentibacterales bacterium]|nr:nucleoside-diphosphate kinase [Candidatus Fermentibacterales bacterium]
MERTFVILKPNAVQRELVGELISRFEKRGLKITALRMTVLSAEQAELHYAQHREKSFYSDLVSFITSGPSVLIVLEAENAVSVVRQMVGATDPKDALPGTIRGDYANTLGHNMIHASDSAGAAIREIALFFTEEEIAKYTLSIRPWL